MRVDRLAALVGGLFWLGAGLFALFLFGRDVIEGVGWAYYSGYLLFPGVLMVTAGLWLVRRSLQSRR